MSSFDASTALGGDDFRCLIPGLPDELAILCLGKVSLCYRHVLRAVCTSWRDVFNDKHFWDGRPSETLIFFRAPNACRRHIWHCLYQSTKEWVRLPPMPQEFIVHGSLTSAVIGEMLFVIGGWTGNWDSPVASSRVWYFDMKRYKWLSAGPLHVGRANSSVGVINNKLYVCGGMIGYVTPWRNQAWTSTAEVYDPTPQGRRWTSIPNMNFPRKVDHGTVIDEELHVPFKVGSRRDRPLGTKYDPLSNKWSDISDELSTTLRGARVIFNGKIFKQTGSGLQNGAQNAMDIVTYNAEKDTSELFQRLVIENDVVTHGKELLVFEEKLCIVYRHLHGDILRYVIKDLENRVLASSGSLDLGPQEELMHDVGPESFEYQIMVL